MSDGVTGLGSETRHQELREWWQEVADARGTLDQVDPLLLLSLLDELEQLRPEMTNYKKALDEQDDKLFHERQGNHRLRAEVEQLRSIVRDIIYGLRNQPEISREQIANAIERALGGGTTDDPAA